MVCECGHEKHADSEPTVCSSIFCDCEKFVEKTIETSIPDNWDGYVNEMYTLQNNIGNLLADHRYLRTLNNTEFIDWFRKNIANKSPESIIRAKRKLVEIDFEKYGNFEITELEKQKQLKRFGIEQWVIQ